MIYSNREVRLFRGVVIAISFATLAVAGLTFLSSRSPNLPEIVAAVVLAVVLYLVGETLLPDSLPPPKTPPARDPPPAMEAWNER